MTLITKTTLGLRNRRWVMQIAAALLSVFAVTANAQDSNRLQDIQVQSLPGQRVELKLIMSGTAPDPLAFTIDDPARIALDLPDTTLGLSSRRRDVNLGREVVHLALRSRTRAYRPCSTP